MYSKKWSYATEEEMQPRLGFVDQLPSSSSRRGQQSEQASSNTPSTAVPSIPSTRPKRKSPTSKSTPPPTKKSKPSPPEPESLATLENTQTYPNPTTGKADRLITTINVLSDLHYRSMVWVDVTFDTLTLSSRGLKEIRKNVGYLKGVTINRHLNSQKGLRDIPFWITEFLTPGPQRRPMSHFDGADHERLGWSDEMMIMLQHIYDKNGMPREEYTEKYADALSQEKLHFIPEFLVRAEFRGSGMAQRLMGIYLALLPTVANGQGYTGAVTLSPAAFRNVHSRMERTGKKPHDWHTLEELLTKSYEKSGFTVWSKNKDGFGGGITIMGQIIAAATEPQSQKERDATYALLKGIASPPTFKAVLPTREKPEQSYAPPPRASTFAPRLGGDVRRLPARPFEREGSQSESDSEGDIELPGPRTIKKPVRRRL